MTPDAYQQAVKKASPPSPFVKNFLLAFFIGGSICCFGELLRQGFLRYGVEEKNTFTLVSITLVLLAALTTGLGWYGRLAKYGGAGTLVPITGFANAMSCAAIEFKTEGWILGLGAKLFQIVGPVIVYGTAASVIYGVLLVMLR